MKNKICLLLCGISWSARVGGMQNQPQQPSQQVPFSMEAFQQFVQQKQQNQTPPIMPTVSDTNQIPTVQQPQVIQPTQNVQQQQQTSIPIELLEEFMKTQQAQQPSSLPTLPQPNLIQLPQNQPTQQFDPVAHDQRMQNLENGMQALAQGQPYRAWHYFGAAATGIGSVSALFAVAYFIMWCVQVYGNKTTP
jgi:hypothetical protein